MINLLNNNLPYIICFILVVLVAFYFGIIWLTRETVRDELRLIQHRRNKKRKQLFLKRQKEIEKPTKHKGNERIQSRQNIDMDSYIDPADRYERNENEENEEDDDENNNIQPSGYSGNRLDKGDISMRDIADGLR